MLMLMLMESHADELDDSPMDDDYEEGYRGCYAMLCYAMRCDALRRCPISPSRAERASQSTSTSSPQLASPRISRVRASMACCMPSQAPSSSHRS